VGFFKEVGGDRLGGLGAVPRAAVWRAERGDDFDEADKFCVEAVFVHGEDDSPTLDFW